MQYKLLLLALVNIFLLARCGSKHNYWDISKFHVDTISLHDREEIKLLYTSNGPDYNTDREYYIHLIAVSQQSGDTVNILTTAYNDFQSSHGDSVYNFFDQNNYISKISQRDLDSSLKFDDLADIEKLAPKDIRKVAHDARFDDIADNNYPTVIGTVGKLTSIK